MVTQAVPSPIPPYLNNASRSSSHRSTQSHPHPQHRDYIPSNNLSTGDPNAATGVRLSQAPPDYDSDSDGGSEIGDEMLDSVTWTEIKESHLSNKKWYRRPSPAWVLPFITGAALSLGMNIAPKQELFISLACMSHPPKMDSTPPFDPRIPPGGSWDGDHDDRTVPTMPISTKPMPAMLETLLSYSGEADAEWTGQASNVSLTERSPFDEWFIRQQREEWVRQHTKIGQGHGPDEPGQEQYQEIDPRLCKKDPVVQAVAAKLTMKAMSLVMGILAALTTGFWGQQSDKIGRTRVLAIAEFGLLCSDVSFILVASFPNLVPGGYRFLLVGPLIEGSLGGISTLLATIYAYISDVTPDGSRAKHFSRLTGITMLGFAAGPAIGSFVVTKSGNILLSFYLTSAIHFIYILAILGFLPESLSKEARTALSKNAEVAKATAKRKAPSESSRTGVVRQWLASWFGALAVFLPSTIEGRSRKDWSLTFLAATIFLMNMIQSVMGVKGQYLLYAYGWSTSQLGLYLTLMGTTRGLALLVILPTIFYFTRPRAPPESTEASEQTPLVSGGKSKHSIREAKFDLSVVRISIMVELIAYGSMIIVVSATTFTALTALVTFGSGGPPAATSLALALLPNQRDAGKLFGGLAQLNALSMTLIGPLMFGSVYAATIGTYATAVFGAAATILVLAQVFLAFVKVPGLPEQEVDGERGRERERRI